MVKSQKEKKQAERERYKNNKDKAIEYSSAYYAANKDEINRKRRESYACKTKVEREATRQFVIKESKLRCEARRKGSKKNKNFGVIDGKMRCNKCKKIFVVNEENFSPSSLKANICRYCVNKETREYRKRVFKEADYIKLGLRTRVRAAFTKYSGSKRRKSKNSRQYGIDYQAILDHLGPCPGDRKDYHIDHIIPISLFDFDDPEQVRLAFLPENHQWLYKDDNLAKSNKFELIDFYEYVGKHYKGDNFKHRPNFFKQNKIIHQT